MSPSLLLLFLLVCLARGPSLGLAQRQNWITLLTDDERPLALKEVRKGREYWLQPNAVLESAQTCTFCKSKNRVILSIRFWEKKRLALARGLLMAQGWCRKGDPCRVGPYQSKRLLLRDSLDQWEPLMSAIPLPGVFPPTKRITIHPTRGAAVNSSSLTPEALTAFQISFVTSTAAREEGRRLTITSEDLQWAERILKLPDSSSDRLIDGASLRKLSTWLLKAKTQDMRAEQLPALLASLERQLTASSMFFRPGMERLLPKGYKAKDGEEFFSRRRISSGEKIVLHFVPSSDFDSLKSPQFLTLELKISEKFKFYAMPSKASSEKPVDILKRLDEQMALVMKRLNESESKRQGLEEEVQRLKNAPNISTSGSNCSLLRRQLERLAAFTNASHVMHRETMDLTAVDECFDVKRKKLPGGVYFLKSVNKPVECTAQGDLVALKRDKGDVDFNASWAQYENGLGDVRRSDYFLGLRNLSAITNKGDFCMTLLLTPWRLKASSKKATYDGFRVGPREEHYCLSYQAYKGSLVFDALSVMNGQSFSTHDVDNDNFVGSCAKRFRSGNWHNSCLKCNVFGPKTNDASSGMCCTGLDSTQGNMCSPLASVRMLVRNKAHAGGSRRVVFSSISSGSGSGCAKLKFFTVAASGLYTLTVGGASGGFDNDDFSQPGGRGAWVAAQFFFRKGDRLAAVAGCPGYAASNGGRGGDASWVVQRSKKVLLAVAGGGGGAAERGDISPFPGLHGRATPDGGDSWWDVRYDSPNATSILLLDKVGKRAKGWADLRDRLLTATSGDFQSGGAPCGDAGGGGGGFEGGIGCPTSNNAESGGGGGGSLCSAAEAASCHITEGGNTRRSGFVILERNLCF